MKRAAISALYLAVGLIVSWQFALLASRLAERLSWPLVSTRWHGCWDIEHCQVAVWGYAIVCLFVFGPSAAWTIIGFLQSKRLNIARYLATTLILTAATAVFYLGFYVALWP